MIFPFLKIAFPFYGPKWMLQNPRWYLHSVIRKDSDGTEGHILEITEDTLSVPVVYYLIPSVTWLPEDVQCNSPSSSHLPISM